MIGQPLGSTAAASAKEVVGWVPILEAQYPRHEALRIDQLQADWSALLDARMPRLKRQVQFSALLCLREAVLNALKHGCEDCESARVEIAVCDEHRQLRLCVSDPGEGHKFDPMSRVENVLGEGHRGLLLMSQFPDRFESTRSGAEVAMYFSDALEA